MTSLFPAWMISKQKTYSCSPLWTHFLSSAWSLLPYGPKTVRTVAISNLGQGTLSHSPSVLRDETARQNPWCTVYSAKVQTYVYTQYNQLIIWASLRGKIQLQTANHKVYKIYVIYDVTTRHQWGHDVLTSRLNVRKEVYWRSDNFLADCSVFHFS